MEKLALALASIAFAAIITAPLWAIAARAISTLTTGVTF